MIGFLDSGIGGLTIAEALRRRRPDAAIAYVADTAHLPYGARSADAIRGYCLDIARFLTDACGARSLVIACNTATVAAADHVRRHVDVPVVAVEPAVKPAARITRTGRIGVLATEGTARSERLGHLIRRFADGIEVVTQPCPGLVEEIEADDRDHPALRALVHRYVAPLVDAGCDVLVLGCTHYPLIRTAIEAEAGPGVTVLDAAEAVARRIDAVAPPGDGPWRLYATGPAPCLAREAGRIVGAPIGVRRLCWTEEGLREYATR